MGFIITLILSPLFSPLVSSLYLEIGNALGFNDKINIYIERVEDVSTIEGVYCPSYHINYLSGPNVSDLIVGCILKRPEVKSEDEKIPHAGTNRRCKFENDEECVFYTINFKNVGNKESSLMKLELKIINGKFEMTENIDPKIDLSENKGFFKNSITIIELMPIKKGETATMMVKASKNSDINIVCLGDSKNVCSLGLYNTYILRVEKNSDEIYFFNDRSIKLPIIQNWNDIKFFRFNFGLNKWEEEKDVGIELD